MIQPLRNEEYDVSGWHQVNGGSLEFRSGEGYTPLADVEQARASQGPSTVRTWGVVYEGTASVRVLPLPPVAGGAAPLQLRSGRIGLSLVPMPEWAADEPECARPEPITIPACTITLPSEAIHLATRVALAAAQHPSGRRNLAERNRMLCAIRGLSWAVEKLKQANK